MGVVRVKREGERARVAVDNPHGNARSRQDQAGPMKPLLTALADAGADPVNAGTAENAAGVDHSLIQGHGSPRWKGGARYWAVLRVNAAIRAALASRATACPCSWARVEHFVGT